MTECNLNMDSSFISRARSKHQRAVQLYNITAQDMVT